MQKVRELYFYLKKVNEEENILHHFPQIKDENNFQEFLAVFNELMEKFGQKLIDYKNQQKYNSNQQTPLIQMDKQPFHNENLDDTSSEEHNKKLNLEKQEKQLQKEIYQKKKKLQKLKDDLNVQKKINENLEKNLNLDSIKRKLGEQIEINSKMREKILLLSYLDDSLKLGFKEEIAKSQNQEIFNKILQEKIKETEILKNFAIIEDLKNKKIKQFKQIQTLIMNIIHQNNRKQDQNVKKKQKSPNRISTTLYNIYTFLPLGLYNQFKLVSNMYFLMIGIFSVLPEISPIDPYSAFLPIIYVILFSLCFDWYYDMKRYLSDRKTNNMIVNIIRNSELIEIKAQDLEVGDFLIVKENERTMADIILFTFSSTNDYCYIDTSSLDGEKTLKPKFAILDKNLSIETFQADKPIENKLIIKDLNLNFQENEDDLSNFEGRIRLNFHGQQYQQIHQNLDINNFIPRTAMIRNTSEVIGLVVYVGADTKIMKNMQQRIFKKSTLEYQMHRNILYILVFLIILLFFLSFYSLFTDYNFDFDKNVLKRNFSPALQFLISMLSYITLMNTIIPISLIITFQITKLVQNFLYLTQEIYIDRENDKSTLINSTDLNEELGQVEYILSDKTGTLTQNKMVAKNFLIQYQNVILDDTENFQQLKNFQQISLKSQDNQESYEIDSQDKLNFLYYLLINTNHNCFAKGVINDQDSSNVYDQFKTHTEFEGPSPDEIALLKASRDFCGILLKGADSRICTLLTFQNKTILIEKAFIFKFDSTRKMMSIIIKFEEKYFLLVKGADTSINERSIFKPEECFWKKVDDYLEKGLRVMFMGIKLISQQEFQEFQTTLEQIQIKGTPEEIYSFKSSIEKNLHLIGASAIEDKLQEELSSTIEVLKLAGIKIWVITGDKSDTAENIAYASGLFDKNYKTLEMDEEILSNILRDSENFDEKKKKNKRVWRWSRQIEGVIKSEKIPLDQPLTPRISLQIRSSKQINIGHKENLMVPGNILALALQSINKMKFTNYLKKFNCVVFSRTNPKQKVEIVRLLKVQNIKTLAIGDGANDVNMIQEANVGIGIIGEEGKQAINASDYAIPAFRYLQHMVLNFGRRCYYNNSAYILQFFYKNIFLTMAQFYYAFDSDFSAQNIYQDWYLAFYNTFFTAFMHPGFAVQNIDLDTNANYYQKGYILEAYVYFIGQINKSFNFQRFVMWIGVGIFDSLFCFIFLYFFFNDDIYYENHEGNYTPFSYALFFVVVISINFKIIYSTFSYGVFNILGIILSLTLFFIYTFATNSSVYYGYYKGVQQTYAISKFWFIVIFLIFSLLLINNFYFSAKRFFFQNIKDKIRSLDGRIQGKRLIEKLEDWKDNHRDARKELLKKLKAN